jgi:hypothetical protein
MTLDNRQQRAAAILGAGGTREDAAESAQVNRGTISRWGKLPAFVEAVKSAQVSASASATEDIPALLDAMQRATDYQGRPDWSARATALRLKLALGLIGDIARPAEVVSVPVPRGRMLKDGKEILR